MIVRTIARRRLTVSSTQIASLTGTFARLAASLEDMQDGLDRLERAVEAANERIAAATRTARHIAEAAEAVESTLAAALAPPEEEAPAPATTPREEVLEAIDAAEVARRRYIIGEALAELPPANGTPTPTLPPVVTIHPDGLATLAVPEGMAFDEADVHLTSALGEAPTSEAAPEAPAPTEEAPTKATPKRRRR